MSSDIVVLTCAAGKQCGHLIPHLLDSVKLRLVVNSGSSLARLKQQYPSAEVVQADLLLPEACRRVVQDAATIYHVGPPLHPFERQIGFNMIDAVAQEQRSRPAGKPQPHFVLSSVLWPQLSKLLHHAQKREVEEYLVESPLRWTVLSPTHFIDLIPVDMLAKQAAPIFPMMWSPDTLMSFVALKDLAEVSARVILAPDEHMYAQYPVVSTPPATYATVLEELATQLGKKVKVDRLSYDDAVQRFMKLSYGDAQEHVHQSSRMAGEMMLLHYRHYGLVGNPGVTRWLLGREPTGYAEWFKEKLAAVKS